MDVTLPVLADLVRTHREFKGLTQEALAKALKVATNRSAIAHLEQGLRVPAPEVLIDLCTELGIPPKFWQPFTDREFQKRLLLEDGISELVGRRVSLSMHDQTTVRAAEEQIARAFERIPTEPQAHDALNSILTYYGHGPVSKSFFSRYLRAESFKSPEAFRRSVEKFQGEAIRLFSSFAAAFDELNRVDDLDKYLEAFATRSDDPYRQRTEWNEIELIPDERLPDLGYISAGRVRQQLTERQALASFLNGLADEIRKDKKAVEKISEKKRRKMDSLLRRFGTSLQHTLISPLFSPDPDRLEREAELIAPKESADLARIEETQAIAQRNLARYLAADHLDVYVATSMRSDADFVSVNSFVARLFIHEEVRPLKLRYFNPTQSWIEDRVAKGLVEALMLRRSAMTIYMAQKDDTFGKDSEASVALGQGKPVIVYVPKLMVAEADIDSESLGKSSKQLLHELVAREGNEDDKELDETLDHQALLSRLLELRLSRSSDAQLADVVRQHWADFDLYDEAQRIGDADDLRAAYRRWLDGVIKERRSPVLDQGLRSGLLGILVATAVNYERRAKMFREIHPLALQVILSTGVLNGILVTRSIDSCAMLIGAIVRNDLSLRMEADAQNYRLIEESTDSTVRVISRHQLIGHAFSTHFRR